MTLKNMRDKNTARTLFQVQHL